MDLLQKYECIVHIRKRLLYSEICSSVCHKQLDYNSTIHVFYLKD